MVKIMEYLRYDVCSNQTRNISIMKVTMTRDSTHKLDVDNLATTLNRRPVSRAVTVIASYKAPCLYSIGHPRIHASVKDCY